MLKRKAVGLGEFDVYTPEEAAKVLRLSVKLVRALCRDGDLPARKVHRSWRIGGWQIKAFVDGCARVE